MLPVVRTFLGATLLASLALGGCTDSADDTTDCAKCDSPGERAKPELCVAIRGNGQLVTAHFAALARITEHYGLIDAAAGGSSGSISSFLTESVRLNPNIWECGDGACSERERSARAALLLKSFPGYLMHLQTTDEAAAFLRLQPLLAKLQTSDVETLLATDAEAAREALLDLLKSPDLRDLINPEVIDLLRTSPNPDFHVADIVDSIKNLGKFDAASDRIFLRPGLLSFEALGEKIGRAASFYAGYGPANDKRMQAWLDACAEPGLGKTWFEVAGLPAGASTCGGELDSMIREYRAAFIADEANIHSRVDDEIGKVMPALISTSVVTGPSVDAFATARRDYLAGTPTPLAVDFDDVKFGYFGHRADLERVAANGREYGDAKTARFLALGEATWRTALSYSPAEPGLTRALELPSGDVSFGGWSDLAPTLVLKNLGCEQVILVTRRGEESPFAVGVARLLGMDASVETALYDLDSDSAYATSVAEADATWCTDWNNQNAADLPGITADSFSAPMETSDKGFTSGENAYPNARAGLGIRGCTPGAK